MNESTESLAQGALLTAEPLAQEPILAAGPWTSCSTCRIPACGWPTATSPSTSRAG